MTTVTARCSTPFGMCSKPNPAQCDRDGLARLVRHTMRVRGWLDAIDARIAAQASSLAAEGASADAATVLTGGGRRSRRDAEAAAARGAVCARMTAFGAALANGSVSAGHLDAVVKAASSLDEQARSKLAEHADELVVAAASSSPEQFESEVRDVVRYVAGDGGLSRHERLRQNRNVRRWVDHRSGMCTTSVSLDPLADARVWTAINAAVHAARATNQRDDDRTWDQLHADVVVDLLCGAHGAGPGERAGPEVSVLIDYQTLLDGVHEASTCETSDGQQLPVETVRRLCCEADVVPIVLGGTGEVLDVGRQCRVATRAQRRALRAMHRTCAHPQCTMPFDACRIHHVTYWFHGGTSDLANLVPLCETHHHLVHEGGWTLRLFPDRRVVWSTPDGTIHHDGPTADRLPTRCHAPRPTEVVRCPPATAAEVGAALELALAENRYRAPP